MRRYAAILALCAGVAGLPVTLAAQGTGLPLRNAGIPRGLTVGAEVGFPNAASGQGTVVGGSAAVGFGLLGVSASVARVNLEEMAGSQAEHVLAAGLTGAFRLIGGPLVPFAADLQAGVGRWGAYDYVYAGDDILYEFTRTTFTAGLGLSLTIPSPIVSLKPWLAPRAEHARLTDNYGSEAITTTRPALGAGIDLGFINGTSLRGAYDRVFLDGADTSVWSVGLAHTLRIGL